MTRLIYTFLINLFCTIIVFAQKKDSFRPKEVFKSNDLIITQISGDAFIHTSFKQTNDFGYVPCNGLIVRNNKEAIVFDTPTTDSTSVSLIRWIKET